MAFSEFFLCGRIAVGCVLVGHMATKRFMRYATKGFMLYPNTRDCYETPPPASHLSPTTDRLTVPMAFHKSPVASEAKVYTKCQIWC